MGRYGQPDDLIGALVWLLSDASSFVTGVVVPIDGGFSSYLRIMTGRGQGCQWPT